MTAEIEYVENAFAFLRDAPSESVDVIITDPPYSEHVHANLCSGSLVGTKNVPKYELGFAPLTGYEWLADALRVARRWVILFSDLEAFGPVKQAYPKEYQRGNVWYKTNAMGQLTKDRPAAAFEGVIALHPKGKTRIKQRWNGRGSYGIWRCSGTRGKKDRHPNEKPMDLCRKLVALFSERGEMVLDPFCGSAAIGQACNELGRDYLGIDFDPVWVDKARVRMLFPGHPLTDEAALALCSMKGADLEDPPTEE